VISGHVILVPGQSALRNYNYSIPRLAPRVSSCCMIKSRPLQRTTTSSSSSSSSSFSFILIRQSIPLLVHTHPSSHKVHIATAMVGLRTLRNLAPRLAPSSSSPLSFSPSASSSSRRTLGSVGRIRRLQRWLHTEHHGRVSDAPVHLSNKYPVIVSEPAGPSL